MKRELKRYVHQESRLRVFDCRAYPDEKGIETGSTNYNASFVVALQSLSR